MLEARNRVLRVDFEFPNYEFVITRGKDRRKDKGSTPEYLTKLIGTLSSTIQAVLTVRLQFDFLQQQQTVSLKQTQSYLTLVKLTPMTKNGLL